MKIFEHEYPSNLMFRDSSRRREYLKFTVEGPVTEVGPAFRQIYDSWLPTSGVKLTGYYDLEMYDERVQGTVRA